MMNRPRLAITLGDPNGIGPEVVLKALLDPDLTAAIEPVLVGEEAVLAAHANALGLPLPPFPIHHPIASLHPSSPSPVVPLTPSPVAFGQITAEAGAQAMQAVDAAINLCLRGEVDAMVTAPISKEAIVRAGYDVPGHTEFIAAKTGGTPLMVLATEHDALAGAPLRVALATTHVPVARIAAALTPAVVDDRLRRLHRALVADYGLATPRIAVFGLNPHAGDGGVLGREEVEWLGPLLEVARADGLHADGPFPADGFFGQRAWTRYDAILAMYHDQGLAPFKALAMGGGVNVTLGLPIVRTSPDHGTAFSIAGQGVADAGSMQEALRLAAQIARRRLAA